MSNLQYFCPTKYCQQLKKTCQVFMKIKGKGTIWDDFGTKTPEKEIKISYIS